MRKLEGSNYGLHLIGFLDPVFLFLHKFQVFLWFIQLLLQKEGKGQSN